MRRIAARWGGCTSNVFFSCGKLFLTGGEGLSIEKLLLLRTYPILFVRTLVVFFVSDLATVGAWDFSSRNESSAALEYDEVQGASRDGTAGQLLVHLYTGGAYIRRNSPPEVP